MQDADSAPALPAGKLPQYLTTKDCARILRVHYLTMRKILRGKNGPPVVRISQIIRIPTYDFLDWLENKYVRNHRGHKQRDVPITIQDGKRGTGS